MKSLVREYTRDFFFIALLMGVTLAFLLSGFWAETTRSQSTAMMPWAWGQLLQSAPPVQQDLKTLSVFSSQGAWVAQKKIPLKPFTH